MIKDIIKICKKHNVILNGLQKKDIDECILNIKEMIITRKIFPDNPRILIAELLKYQQSLKLKELKNDPCFCSTLNEILEHDNYTLKNDFLICNKFISCSIIQSNNKITILDSTKSTQIRSLGYGISEYRIFLNKKIREVYCKGKHPNINPNSKQFCIDPYFLDSDLNYQNLLILEELLSQFNIKHSYLDFNETKQIENILSNDKKKEVIG